MDSMVALQSVYACNFVEARVRLCHMSCGEMQERSMSIDSARICECITVFWLMNGSADSIRYTSRSRYTWTVVLTCLSQPQMHPFRCNHEDYAVIRMNCACNEHSSAIANSDATLRHSRLLHLSSLSGDFMPNTPLHSFA